MNSELDPPAGRDQRHERLCAHLLGELDGPAAAAVEAELAADGELRAEAERLRATLGLLREHLGAEAADFDPRAANLAAAVLERTREPQAELSPEGLQEAPGGTSSGMLSFPRRQPWLAAAGMVGLVGAGVLAGLSTRGSREGVFAPATQLAAGGARVASRDGSAAVGAVGGEAEGPRSKGLRDLAALPPEALTKGEPKQYYLASASEGGETGSRGGGRRGQERARLGESLGLERDAAAGEVPDAAYAEGLPAGLAGMGYYVEPQLEHELPTEGAMRALEFLGYLDAPAIDTPPAEPPSSPFAAGDAFNDVIGVGGSAGGGGESRAGSAALRQLVPAATPAAGGDDSDFKGATSNLFGGDLRQRAVTATRPVQDDEEALGRLLARRGLSRDRLPDLLEALGYVDAGEDGSVDEAELQVGLDRLVSAERLVIERELAEERLRSLLASTCRRPGESLAAMYFRHWGARPFVETAVDPQSTFAADVDTASYTLARAMLLRGILPAAAQIRPEEFVNYFDAGLPAPTEDVFAIHTDLGPSPFGGQPAGWERFDGDGRDLWLLRVALLGREVSEDRRQPLALTFVIDTSGSMARDDRLGLVRDSLRQLLTRLDSRDSLTLVGFSNEARLLLPRTHGGNRGPIEAVLAALAAEGGTNLEAGLVRGYELAAEHLDPQANNRVVLLSDGVGNIGQTDRQRLTAQVAEQRAKGISLNTVGVGLENHNDVLLEQLADRGDGVYNYVDSLAEARRALVENFTGTLETIARDVKIQVEFDPARVGRYRLIGYENRALADREFRRDEVDAGEVGAGHQVVALYELGDVDLSDGLSSLATVRVRFKPPFAAAADRAAGLGGEALEPPTDEQAREIERKVYASGAVWSFEALPLGLAAQACAAQLAEVLRQSAHARGDSLALLEQRSLWVAERSSDEAFREFAALVSANRAAFERHLTPADRTAQCIDELKFLRYELEREREAEGAPDPQLLAALEQRIAELEAELRRLVLPATAMK
jgi:Ca-activated chloride channel family protein